jgi:hypothetical protein
MAEHPDGDHASSREDTPPRLRIAGREIPLPRSRPLRIGAGTALIVLGLFGFLPILGFWMLPLGLLVLSYDIPLVRRLRRRIVLWWKRRQQTSNV